jgi:penicillin-binding protein 2
MPETRGAVVVMDPRSGDILAMCSSPTFSPNHFTHPLDPTPWDAVGWTNSEVRVQRSRAIQENFHPGSIFKIVVGLSGLELGLLDPNAEFDGLGYFDLPDGSRRIRDDAGAGKFNFNRALAKSSNAYFIFYGIKPGMLQKIIELGRKLHLGEKTEIVLPDLETKGSFPTPAQLSPRNWRLGDTANLSIGQGKIDVTPVQMAVMVSAIANGGKVYWPRVVAKVESSDGAGPVQVFPGGRVRDNLGVSERSLDIVRRAMLDDVQSREGTGRASYIDGWPIAGKTGTAQVEKNGHIDKQEGNTWFVSYAPYNDPHYAVVVMVEGGISGGITCAPVAKLIYQAIVDKERKAALKLAANPPRQ